VGFEIFEFIKRDLRKQRYEIGQRQGKSTGLIDDVLSLVGVPEAVRHTVLDSGAKRNAYAHPVNATLRDFTRVTDEYETDAGIGPAQ